jgi:hypothetical protein
LVANSDDAVKRVEDHGIVELGNSVNEFNGNKAVTAGTVTELKVPWSEVVGTNVTAPVATIKE